MRERSSGITSAVPQLSTYINPGRPIPLPTGLPYPYELTLEGALVVPKGAHLRVLAVWLGKIGTRRRVGTP